MAKKFYAQKDALGFPIPGTMMSTTGKVPADSLEIPSAVAVEAHPAGLRYFVRRDKKGNIIPNSLIASLKKPAGNVVEFTEGAAASMLLTEADETITAENEDLLVL